MNPRKVIRKITWILLVIAGISLLALLTSIPYRDTENQVRIDSLNARINEITQSYPKYLDSLAKKITLSPVEPRIIAEIQSNVLLKRNQITMYLWMNDAKEKFLFGAPPQIFQRLSLLYQQNDVVTTFVPFGDNAPDRDEPEPVIPNEEVIHNEKFAVDFNDFLIKNVHRSPEMMSEEFSYEVPNYYYYVREPFYDFSQPVLGASGELIGTLFLKIDDSANERLYYKRGHFQYYDIFSEMIFPPARVILILSLLILWFLLPTWVYIDAKERGVKNPRGMALLSFFALPFGIIIYLITRPINLKQLTCPKCSQEVNGIKNYCPYCGFDFSSVLCPQCQYPVQSDWSFCPNCRADLNTSKANVNLNDAKVLGEEQPS